jgi:hypothetical protein
MLFENTSDIIGAEPVWLASSKIILVDTDVVIHHKLKVDNKYIFYVVCAFYCCYTTNMIVLFISYEL